MKCLTISQLLNDAAPRPVEGDVICVRGIYKTFPERSDGTFVMNLFNDLLESSEEGGEKIEVRIKVNTNTKPALLRSKTVRKYLKEIRSGARVAARGRVAKFDLESIPANLRFTVVIDSEDHSLLYEENEEELPSVCFGTSSQQVLMYPAQVDGELLKVGSKIKKTDRRVFCLATASYDEITKNVIAFKNSFDGDIFVGVESNGEVSGRPLAQGDILKWREKMALMIGGILPGTDEQVCFWKQMEKSEENVSFQ